MSYYRAFESQDTSEVTAEQATRVLLKYMDAHPEETHERAEPLAVAAFRTAWPCN